MSQDEYRSSPALNWSILKYGAKSWAHFHQERLAPHPTTEAEAEGDLLHILTLDPSALETRIAVWEGGTRRGKIWDAFQSEHADKSIFRRQDISVALSMSAAVHASPQSRELLQDGVAEVPIRWCYDGLWCKSRLDYVRPDMIVELKSTRDASPEGFARDSWRYMYHGQCAMYQDAELDARGVCKPVAIIAVEKQPPYVVQVYLVPDHLLDIGCELYRGLIAQYQKCLASGDWPAYASAPLQLGIPRWAGVDDDEIDLGEIGLETV